MKIGIFTQYNEPFKPVADITIPVLQDYANRHGYDLHVSVDPPIARSIVWDRYKVIADNIRFYDWVAHFDADVLVTNHHIRLEEFTDHGKSVVMSRATREDGTTMFNDGVALFRNRPDMDYILDFVNNHQSTHNILCGQDVFEYGPLFLRDCIHVERQKSINSFLYRSEYNMPETTLGNWTMGDFVLHLPGCSNQRRVDIFNQYKEWIIRCTPQP